MVRDIPAGDGNVTNLFYGVGSLSIVSLFMVLVRIFSIYMLFSVCFKKYLKIYVFAPINLVFFRVCIKMVLNKLVDFGLACAPVRCAHLSFWGICHAKRGAARPPLLHIHTPKIKIT